MRAPRPQGFLQHHAGAGVVSWEHCRCDKSLTSIELLVRLLHACVVRKYSRSAIERSGACGVERASGREDLSRGVHGGQTRRLGGAQRDSVRGRARQYLAAAVGEESAFCLKLLLGDCRELR